MSINLKGKFHRQNMISRFAKSLVRRSRSRCELCARNGIRLNTFEVPPPPEEPHPDHCLFLCDSCRRQIEDPQKMNPHQWHCLNRSVWAATPAVQVMSLRLLRRLSTCGEQWAEDILDHAVLDEELEQWAGAAE